MNGLGLNPYLPHWETVPDGEPHEFDGRVYIYGSHDDLGGTKFCAGDYVCWSAPADDLRDWKCEGVIYRKDQDPINGAPYDKDMPPYQAGRMGGEGEMHCLYAPDVAKGPDGRYYLYYALDSVNVMSVAVCDTPAGQYEFLDYVRRPDGSLPGGARWFDPAILCEESGNYLYYGFCPPKRFPGMGDTPFEGAMMVKLADDMHTILTEPKCVAFGPEAAQGTDYAEHPFFEAASIRKIGDWYYFVYSSVQGNELCYGMAKSPEGPFAYKGVIISNGDLGYQGNTLRTNYTGNNHGGLLRQKDRTYIFWHRQTHGTMFSRQGCADEVEILPDGTIPQVEITSCGLNGGPLPAAGYHQSYIACHLTGPDRSAVGDVFMSFPGQPMPQFPADMPYITEETEEPHVRDGQPPTPYIYNLHPGALAGFKYLAFDGSEGVIKASLRGTGSVTVLLDEPEGQPIASFSCDTPGPDWTECGAAIEGIVGTHAVYFLVDDGVLDFAWFAFA